MAYLTRQQALDIINKAPSNLNKESLLKELARTNTIEGYNEQAPKSNILKDIGREIIKPFAQGAELVSSGGKAFGSVLKAGYQSATGNKEAAKKTIIEAAKKAENRPELNILGQKVANIKTGKQAVGTALNLASNFVGGGAAKNIAGGIAKQTLPRLIWQGAKQGAKAGALYGAGTALQEDRNVITGALKGTAGGAIGGAVFPIAGKALKVATSPFSTAINKISPKLDKIANKIETIITKPSKQDLAHGFKTENIFKYDLGGGLGKSLNKTQNLIDDLVTRAENIRGESRSIIDLSPIIKEASDEIANSKITNIGNNKKILNAFKLWVKEIEDIAPEGKVDTVGAQKIKVALGRMGSWLNGQRDLDSSAMESVSNVLYTKFKNAVENAVDDPAELRAINQQLSELIPISNVLTKRIPIADRNSIMPLTDIIGTSAGLIEPKAWGVVAVNKLSKSGGFANLLYKGSQKLKSGATKLLPLETGIKKSLKNIKPGLTIEDVSKKKLKYKTTVNIQDKNDLEYLGRILSEDNINDIKSGKMVNFRGTPYEDLARVNIISKKPLTVEQQLSGKISDVKLKSDTFYHGTSAENAKSIMSSGFKKGSELPEDIFRGGGYGKMQNSISLADTPKDASRFSKLTRGGEIVEAKLKPNSKIVSIKGIEDANDLDDFLPYLKKQKIDAVYIGGGEKELVVINPEVVTPTKSQLTDIWNKANGKTKIKSSTDSLISEAKKYKSADEFVKAQSLYHGTPNELEGGVLKFGAGKQLKKGGYMGGHFLTDTPEIAENFSFGGKVYQASGEIKNKVLDVNKNKKLFQDYIGKEYLLDGEKVKFTKQDFDYMFPNGKADWSTINIDLLEQLTKKQGKIGVSIPEYAGGKQGMTYQIFEDNIPVYTKSQLVDIWNKANKLKTKLK